MSCPTLSGDILADIYTRMSSGHTLVLLELRMHDLSDQEPYSRLLSQNQKRFSIVF